MSNVSVPRLNLEARGGGAGGGASAAKSSAQRSRRAGGTSRGSQQQQQQQLQQHQTGRSIRSENAQMSTRSSLGAASSRYSSRSNTRRSEPGIEEMTVEELQEKQAQLTNKLFAVIGDLHLAKARKSNPAATLIPSPERSKDNMHAFFRNQMRSTASSTYGMIQRQHPGLLATNRHRRKKTDLSRGRY